MVAAAVVVHATWGVVLLFSGAPLHTTPLGSLPTTNRIAASAMYLIAAGLAVVPIARKSLDTKITGLLLTGPQQYLLMASFWTAMVSILKGAYPDGYVPNTHGDPHLFIFVDQLWPVVGMMAHTLSLLDWYWWSLTRPVQVERQ